MTPFSSWLAILGLSLREALRQRLWLLFAVAGAAVMIVGLSLQAVDSANKLKLAVVAITAAISFVVVLLAVLVGSGQVRRDLDARVAFLLFAKPMPRLSYLLGRWSGVQLILLTGIVSLSLVGTGMIWATFKQVPAIYAVTAPSEWVELSALGETLPISDGSDRKMLSGQPGNGVRWTLRGLPTDDAAYAHGGLDLLLRCQVRSVDYGLNIQECLVQLSATAGPSLTPAAPSAPAVPRLLQLAADSPYGQGTEEGMAGEGQVVVRHREQLRNDYSADYARLKLVRDSVSADGTAVVQITRLDSRAQLIVTRTNSLKVTRPGGSLAANLMRGGLVLLASAAMLTAWTLFIGTLSNLGVTLLAGLTLFFAGSALWTIQDTLVYEKLSLPAQRVLQLMQLLLPDFERFQVAANLAAGQAITWNAVLHAWLYFGVYTLVFLGMGWLALVRKEL
jgi:ABC-type transport system involved in multi-copper enzyme maturation permease subunit